MLMGVLATPSPEHIDIRLTNVPGFFAQDLPETDPTSFDYVCSPLPIPYDVCAASISNMDLFYNQIKSNFGLLDEFTFGELLTPDYEELEERIVAPWGRFKHAISALNRGAPKGTSYRVMFLARHGQGYHNVAEEYYGTSLWDVGYYLSAGIEFPPLTAESLTGQNSMAMGQYSGYNNTSPQSWSNN
jgi:hypothetical protein